MQKTPAKTTTALSRAGARAGGIVPIGYVYMYLRVYMFLYMQHSAQDSHLSWSKLIYQTLLLPPSQDQHGLFRLGTVLLVRLLGSKPIHVRLALG